MNKFCRDNQEVLGQVQLEPRPSGVGRRQLGRRHLRVAAAAVLPEDRAGGVARRPTAAQLCRRFGR